MKAILSLIILLPIMVLSQGYKQMANHNSEWHLSSCNFSCLNDIYYTDGDTTYQGENYKILNGFHYISKTFWIRENVNEKKIYFSTVQGNKRTEILLYDFSLQVGDSMDLKNPVSPFPTNVGYHKVDSIVEKTIYNGEVHKHFYLSSTASNPSNARPIWIEGIGSLSLINAPGATPNVNGAGKLSCHFDDGELIYTQLDSLDACIPKYFFADVNENYFENNLQVYPTLVDDLFTVETSIEITKITIHNSVGEVVKLVSNFNEHANTVDFKKFDAGIYFVQITSKKYGVLSKRIVKL